ncbi:hypothetical protein [Microbacterium sp. CFBP9034]|uniref:hypothetical protein n=1 Tax=Microbacterium sp. CFBP9034 TaxID=3096540 RepID=UPI002A69CE47|nr:hypothetical protein [Microbacterium sp. CFBP9034]MDY0908482.1 hypothetical protein [Microbacterium sp. CFBP9034]
MRAVSGAAGWVERAIQALREGAAGVVVVAPVAEAVDSLRKAAAELDAFVILDQHWRSNPAVVNGRDAVGNLDALISFAGIAVNVPTVDDVEQAVHESVQIAHHVIGAVENLRILHRQSRSVLMSGTVGGGAPLTITIAVGPAIERPFHVRVVAGTGGVHLSVPDPGTAAPGVVTIVHADGSTTLPTRWESAHRASWRRVITAFEQRERPDDLREFDDASQLLFSGAPLS